MPRRGPPIFFYLAPIISGVNSGPLSAWPPGVSEIEGRFLLASRAGKTHFFFGQPVLGQLSGVS